MTNIWKSEAQILNAQEYELLRAELNPTHRILFDGMLFTGMRIEEFWRFLDNPHWFQPDRNYVGLPRGSIKKVQTRYKERTVLLSNIGVRAIRDLVDLANREKLSKISRMGWGQNLKRAALKAKLEPRGIVPKMARKTWVSWLMVTYPEDGLRVAASLGHDLRTMQEHYLSLPVTAMEREQIRPSVVGWGGRA